MKNWLIALVLSDFWPCSLLSLLARTKTTITTTHDTVHVGVRYGRKCVVQITRAYKVQAARTPRGETGCDSCATSSAQETTRSAKEKVC